MRKDIETKLMLSEVLTKECMRILNLTTNEDGCIINNNDIMEWNDMESISLDHPISPSILLTSLYKEDDVVDGVLFFGDGTIEFHLANDGDAVNWADFDVDFIKMIIRELKRNQCSKFA